MNGEAPVTAARVFGALLRRDAHVSARELPFFLVRTCLQPLLFVVVFGYLLPRMGFVARGYGAALLPGILAVSLALSSVQAVALPMVADFGFTREIDDRLLAPVPVRMVALEKVVFGVLQGLVAAAVVLPVARLIMGPVPGLTPYSSLGRPATAFRPMFGISLPLKIHTSDPSDLRTTRGAIRRRE